MWTLLMFEAFLRTCLEGAPERSLAAA